MCRGSETQLQVGENLNKVILYENQKKYTKTKENIAEIDRNIFSLFEVGKCVSNCGFNSAEQGLNRQEQQCKNNDNEIHVY